MEEHARLQTKLVREHNQQEEQRYQHRKEAAKREKQQAEFAQESALREEELLRKLQNVREEATLAKEGRQAAETAKEEMKCALDSMKKRAAQYEKKVRLLRFITKSPSDQNKVSPEEATRGEKYGKACELLEAVRK